MILIRKHVKILLLCLVATVSACRGGELCGVLVDPISDTDADCVLNAEDNCLNSFNPSQTDGDGDGVGLSCDIDDSNTSCGPTGTTCTAASSNISAPLDVTVAAYPAPLLLNSADSQTAIPSDCQAYLVACGGDFLGYVNNDASDPLSIANPDHPYGDTNDENSIFNSLGFYGRSFTSCSAFNPDALLPPAVFCESNMSADDDVFVGYLTLNPLVDQGMDVCELLADLSLNQEACD